MEKKELHDRLTRIGINVSDAQISHWRRTGWVSTGPQKIPIKRSDIHKSKRFRKTKSFAPGRTGEWSEDTLVSIAEIWSVRYPQNDQILPLPLERLDNTLSIAYIIQFHTTAMFPLDWGVPDFLTSWQEVDKTNRWLASNEVHPYVVRLICTRQKVLNEIHIKEPIKVNLIWEEELVEQAGASLAGMTQYRLKPITFDRNLDIDAVELRVVPLERTTDDINYREPKKTDNTLTFFYEIDSTLRALPKVGSRI